MESNESSLAEYFKQTGMKQSVHFGHFSYPVSIMNWHAFSVASQYSVKLCITQQKQANTPITSPAALPFRHGAWNAKTDSNTQIRTITPTKKRGMKNVPPPLSTHVEVHRLACTAVAIPDRIKQNTTKDP
jgi:hypothetical protein